MNKKYDLRKNNGVLNIDREDERCYSTEDITEIYGLNQWTVRMWIDLFEMLERSFHDDKHLMLSRHAMKQIGVIYRLCKNKMNIEDIRKYLESDTTRGSDKI